MSYKARIGQTIYQTDGGYQKQGGGEIITGSRCLYSGLSAAAVKSCLFSVVTPQIVDTRAQISFVTPRRVPAAGMGQYRVDIDKYYLYFSTQNLIMILVSDVARVEIVDLFQCVLKS